MNNQVEDNLTEDGVVIAVYDGMARVKAMRRSSCDGCGARTICKPTGGTEVIIEARNDVGASIGERVRVSLKPAVLLKASFIVYILPLIGFFVGGALGRWIGKTDTWAAAFGVILMILTYVGVWIYNKRNRRGKYQPIIIAVLTS